MPPSSNTLWHWCCSGNYKLVLGDPGPPDVWSVPVNESSPLVSLPRFTSWNTTVQLFDVVKDIREETDIAADNQAVVSDGTVTETWSKIFVQS